MAKQEGIALIAALLGLMLLTVLGLTLSFNSITELNISQNHESNVQARLAAQEGLYRAKEYIRSQGLDFDEALRMNPAVPNYGERTIPRAGTYAYRYPISLEAARRLKIFVYKDGSERQVASSGTKDGRGIITRGQLYPDLYPNSNEYIMRPAAEIRGSSAAREDLIISYFAVRVTNNLSREEIDRGGGPFVDKDGKVIIRSMGVARTFNPGSGGNNSVAVIEALVRRDLSAKLSSPFIIDGVEPDFEIEFRGNSFLIDGYNHQVRFRDSDGRPNPDLARQDIDRITSEKRGSVPRHGGAADAFGIGILDPSRSGSAILEVREAMADDGENLQGLERIIGRAGQFTITSEEPPQRTVQPSVGDITNEISNPTSPASNEDAARVLLSDINLRKFINDVKGIADVVLADTARVGGRSTLGTLENPQITFVDGDLDINGTVTGAGVLVVTGELEVEGTFNFAGVILVVGDGEVELKGDVSIVGGMLVAELEEGLLDGEPDVEIEGNVGMFFSGDAIRFAINRLPFETLGFREVRSEYERAILNNSIP